MRKLLFTLMSLACALSFASTTVYKWVDDEGIVHYSDQPHLNATKIQVKDVQTFKATSSGLSTASTAGAPPAPSLANAGHSYQGCAIVQPADATDFANLDSLNIVVQTDPVLRAGDQVFVSVDGTPLNNGAPSSGQVTLSPVDRGTHTVQAMVRGTDGTVLCQTPSVTFSVHQPSVQSPTNPVRPH